MNSSDASKTTSCGHMNIKFYLLLVRALYKNYPSSSHLHTHFEQTLIYK